MQRYIRRARVAIPLTALVAVIGGFAVAQALVSDPPGPPSEPSRDAGAPAPGSQRLDATAPGPAGRTLGVLTYRNRDGQRCMAVGDVQDGRIGRASREGFRPVPLADGGMCGATPAPVAVSVTATVDDPETAANETNTVIAGVAADEVESLRLDAATSPKRQRPGAGGGFLLVVEGVPAELALDVAYRGGKTQRVALPKLPDQGHMDELMEQAREEAGAIR